MARAEPSVLGVAEALDSALREGLAASGYELAGLLPVPARGDRHVRARTLEEILETLDEAPADGPTGGDDSRYYIVQVRGRSARAGAMQPTATGMMPKPSPAKTEQKEQPGSVADSTKLPDGSWNIPYLEQNATLLTRAGEHKLARNIWKILSKTGACTGRAHLGLAVGFEIEGKIEEARGHFQESLAFEPSLEAARGLAATQTRLGRHADAARILERATTLPNITQTSRLELHWACSNAWNRSGKLELAEASAISASEVDPAQSLVHSNLGAIRLKSGRIEDAAKSFRKAIELNATNARAHEGLALCLLETGQKRLAHDHLTRALAANISNPRALQALVGLALELRTYPVAARILTEYVDAHPVNAGLLYSLAGLHHLMGRSEEAMETAARALGLQPGHEAASRLIRKIDRYRIDRGPNARKDRDTGAHRNGVANRSESAASRIGASGTAI